jgi:hypothetical protein
MKFLNHYVKINFLFLIIFIMFVSGCSVNDYESVLSISNESNIYVNNIKIGNTIILLTLAPGASYDYYFYTPLIGSLTTDSAASAGYAYTEDNNKLSTIPRLGTYNLKAGNYFFQSEIFEKNDNYYITIRCNKNKYNYGQDSYDAYADGGYYSD